MNTNVCPVCGCKEFITKPNQYSILIFGASKFEIADTGFCDCVSIYCRECYEEIDENESTKQGKIVLK